MGFMLAEFTWPLLLASVGVLVGWWLRRWSKVADGPARRMARRNKCEAALAQGGGAGIHIDQQTGLSSRAVFIDDVQRRVAEHKRTGAPLSIMLIRIDAFDRIVKRRGERAANVLLVAMSQFLRAMLRDMDHIARFGEDTFGIVIPGANMENAKRVSDRLSRGVSCCRLPLDDGDLTFSITAGIAEIGAGDTAKGVLDRAQASMDEKGRSRHVSASALNHN